MSVTQKWVCRAHYRGVQKRGATREFYYGYNVLAYFDKWDDRGGKHYLPGDVQTLLNEHVTEFFHG